MASDLPFALRASWDSALVSCWLIRTLHVSLFRTLAEVRSIRGWKLTLSPVLRDQGECSRGQEGPDGIVGAGQSWQTGLRRDRPVRLPPGRSSEKLDMVAAQTARHAMVSLKGL